jgi:hypothetical protein
MLPLFVKTAIMALMSLASVLYGTTFLAFYHSITIPPIVHSSNLISATWVLFDGLAALPSEAFKKNAPFLDAAIENSIYSQPVTSISRNTSIAPVSIGSPIVPSLDVHFPLHTQSIFDRGHPALDITPTSDMRTQASINDLNLVEYNPLVASHGDSAGVLSEAQAMALFIAFHVASQGPIDSSNLRSYIRSSDNVSEELFIYLLALVHYHRIFLSLGNTVSVRVPTIDFTLPLPKKTLRTESDNEEKRICESMYRAIKPSEFLPALDPSSLPHPISPTATTMPSARMIFTTESPTFIIDLPTDLALYQAIPITSSKDTFDWYFSSHFQAFLDWWNYSGYGHICEGAVRRFVRNARTSWFKFLWDGAVAAVRMIPFKIRVPLTPTVIDDIVRHLGVVWSNRRRDTCTSSILQQYPLG